MKVLSRPSVLAATVVAVLCGPFIGLIPSAYAGVGIGVAPTFSSPAQIGGTGVPASVQIANNSVAPDNVDPVTIQAITLVPSCGSPLPTGPGNCASPDPGVVSSSATGVGEVGTACAGIVFTITVVDAATGKVSFTPGTPFALQPPGSPSDTCRINFTFNVLKSPTVDSQPAQPGVQTSQIAYATGSNVVTGLNGTSIGGSSITVTASNPTLTTQVSPETVVLGGSVTDTATVTPPAGAPPLTGFVSFDAFGPNDVTCSGVPAFTSSNRPLSGGVAVSGVFTPTQVGTYRFRASYSGDANFNGVQGLCNEIGESVTVTATARRYVPADFDGNGTTDVSVFRPSDGGWYVKGQTGAFWGTTGDIPVPGDYDGNGTTDIAVFRPSDGGWYIRGQAGTSWGTAGDIPVPGDYDGNGTTDIAVFRPGASAAWYVKGQTGAFWGTTGDIPVPGDYDGNNTTDLAVYRPGASAAWYIKGQTGAFWGTTGDIPVPGDYDGNTTTDLAVYRPGADSTWYIKGQPGAYFGTTGDVPLPLPSAIRRVFFP
ncbi:MAG: hypothetical protein QOI99_665 [Actinomycetota bacterium]|nr:hypothetical protein [Actinomycetota bacterium]